MGKALSDTLGKLDSAPLARGLPPREGGALGAGSGGSRGGGGLTPQSEGFDPSERGVAWRKALHTFLAFSSDFLHHVFTGKEAHTSTLKNHNAQALSNQSWSAHTPGIGTLDLTCKWF